MSLFQGIANSFRGSSSRASKRRFMRSMGRTFEPLEPRALMTALYWQGDVSNVWNATDANWSTTRDGSGDHVAWDNNANDDAVFEKAAPLAITIASSINANSISAGTNDVTIAGGELALAHVPNVSASTGKVIIQSAMTGVRPSDLDNTTLAATPSENRRADDATSNMVGSPTSASFGSNLLETENATSPFSIGSFSSSITLDVGGQSFTPNVAGPNGVGSPGSATSVKLNTISVGYGSTNTSARSTTCYVYSAMLSSQDDVGQDPDGTLVAVSLSFQDGAAFGSDSSSRTYTFQGEALDPTQQYYVYFDCDQNLRCKNQSPYSGGTAWDADFDPIPYDLQFQVTMFA